MTESANSISPRLYAALQLTFELFGRDARKSSEVPVLSHLLSVCTMVQFDGGGEDEAVAALLHDMLEDKADLITREVIEAQFGAHVLEIIELSTDTPSDYRGGPKPPWRDRKLAYLDHARHANPAMLRVTIADKIDNARSILSTYQTLGSQVWQRFNAGQADQIWYYQQAVKAYEEAGYRGPLLDELRRLVELLGNLPA